MREKKNNQKKQLDTGQTSGEGRRMGDPVNGQLLPRTLSDQGRS